MCRVLEITNPFINEVRRHILDAETEHIVHLSRENRECDTTGKANNHWIWHEFNDISQFENSNQNQDDSRHDCGNHQASQTMLLDYAVNYHDESACRTANLHLATAKKRDDESRDDSRHEAFRRTDARSDTKGDSQRQRHNTHNKSCHCICRKLRFIVVLQAAKEFRRKNHFQYFYKS